MLSEEQAAAEAARLDGAEQTRSQVTQTTLLFPDLGIDDAYRIQAHWAARRLARGERLIGHKIGLTSRAMQAAMNIDTPDSGFLTDAMLFEAPLSEAPADSPRFPASPADGPPADPVDRRLELAAADYTDPKLEVELAFVLNQDLPRPDHTIDEVLDATDHVVPALELIAARSHRRDPETGRTRTVVDTIADNAANAGIIIGGHRIGPRDTDLRWVPALLYRNGVVEETGVAAGVLDHPATGIIWLARRYAEQGLSLQAGQTILAGSFTRPVDVRRGDRFRADYGPLGAFEVGFT